MRQIRPDVNVDILNQTSHNTMVSLLGIEFTDVGADYLSAKMPVDERTIQPFGILHGGASVALAETLGSLASGLCVDLETQSVVGLEINANHVRSVSKGQTVYGTAKAVHLGRRTHIWDITITNEENNLVCTSRLTIMVVERS